MNDVPLEPASASHALCVYAEPIVSGRRVVLIDDASRGLGARLTALGARLVHTYDPDGGRARVEASRGTRGMARTVRELPAGDFDVRDGAYDVAIVPDLGLVSDPAPVLARLRKLLGNDGVALIGAHNPEARFRLSEPPKRPLDYYELYDLVALQFANVRMIAQVPFVGVTLAELGGEGEAEVTVDTQLVGEGDPPALFLALAAQSDVRLAEYAIVQLPSSVLSDPRGRSLDLASPDSHRTDLVEAQLRASVLAAQLDEARTSDAEEVVRRTREVDTFKARAEEAEARAAEQHVRAERHARDLSELREEIERHAQRGLHLARELEGERVARARAEMALSAVEDVAKAGLRAEEATALGEALSAAEAMVGALRRRLGEVEVQAAAQHEQIAVLVVALDTARRGQVDAAVLAQLSSRAGSAEARAAVLDAELASLGDGHAGELVQLESALRERAQALKAVELEVSRRERIVEELVARLEEGYGASGEVPPLEGHARELEMALAEVERLRRQLAPRKDGGSEILGALRAENDDLRAKLDRLALEVARREGELKTSEWRVAEIEQELARLARLASQRSDEIGQKGSDAVDAERGRLEMELAALRQALTQEHDARVRLESGQELTSARVELARQATLIEQLSRELEAHDRVRVARA